MLIEPSLSTLLFVAACQIFFFFLVPFVSFKWPNEKKKKKKTVLLLFYMFDLYLSKWPNAKKKKKCPFLNTKINIQFKSSCKYVCVWLSLSAKKKLHQSKHTRPTWNILRENSHTKVFKQQKKKIKTNYCIRSLFHHQRTHKTSTRHNNSWNTALVTKVKQTLIKTSFTKAKTVLEHYFNDLEKITVKFLVTLFNNNIFVVEVFKLGKKTDMYIQNKVK